MQRNCTNLLSIIQAPNYLEFKQDQKYTRWDKNPWNTLCKLTHLLSYPNSRDAIAFENKRHEISMNNLKWTLGISFLSPFISHFQVWVQCYLIGKYDESITDAHDNYPSTSYHDELVWAAVWLHLASQKVGFVFSLIGQLKVSLKHMVISLLMFGYNQGFNLTRARESF